MNISFIKISTCSSNIFRTTNSCFLCGTVRIYTATCSCISQDITTCHKSVKVISSCSSKSIKMFQAQMNARRTNHAEGLRIYLIMKQQYSVSKYGITLT